MEMEKATNGIVGAIAVGVRDRALVPPVAAKSVVVVVADTR